MLVCGQTCGRGGCACPGSIPGFNGSEDCAALEQLLEGYDQQDQDQVAEVCNSPLFKYMDNDVSARPAPSPALLSPPLRLMLREEARRVHVEQVYRGDTPPAPSAGPLQVTG